MQIFELLKKFYSTKNQYSYVHPVNMVQQQAQPAGLSVDVPEFFPKVPDVVWLNEEQYQKTQQHYHTNVTENPYQDEMFTYRPHLATRKTVAIYQVIFK